MREVVVGSIVLILLAGTILVIPENVTALLDGNNNFTEAIEVFNNYVVTESLDIVDDSDDYYKIYLDAGEEVLGQLIVPVGQDFDLFLYGPSYALVDSSQEDNPGNGTYYEEVYGIAAVTGWYYLDVFAYSGSGIYDLYITSTADWTFMVYMSDCDLEAQAIDDFLEMSSVGSTTDVNILVQLDRWDGFTWNGAGWDYNSGQDDTRYEDWTTCKRFFITQGMTPIAANALGDIGEVNTADPQTLIDFANWGLQVSPAHNYALVLWDHGIDWHGVCSEEDSTT